VSAVRKVLFDALNYELPKLWIGNMPKRLINQGNYSIKEVGLNNIKNGDLIFVGKNTSSSIDHLMLWLSNNRVFHSCTARNTIIETLKACLDSEYMPLSKQLLINFTDRRTKHSAYP
jgi:hypothetical protein